MILRNARVRSFELLEFLSELLADPVSNRVDRGHRLAGRLRRLVDGSTLDLDEAEHVPAFRLDLLLHARLGLFDQLQVKGLP